VVELLLIITNGLIFQNVTIPQEKKNGYGVIMIIVLVLILTFTFVRVLQTVLERYPCVQRFNKTRKTELQEVTPAINVSAKPAPPEVFAIAQ
jgi:hypothetical protein